MPYFKIDRVAYRNIKGDGLLSDGEKKLITRVWKKKEGLFQRLIRWTIRRGYNG